MFKTKIDRLFGYIRPFTIVLCCALCAMLLMRFAELGYLFTLAKFGVPRVIGRGLLSMFMCLGVATAALLPLYALLAWWRQRLATAVSAALFGLLIFAEAGLTAIALRRGLPIGSELIMRPSSELLHTLNSVMPVWAAVVLCIGSIGAFTCVCLWATRLRLPRWLTAGAMLLLLLTAPFVGLHKTLTRDIQKPPVANYITNKTLYMLQSCMHLSKVHGHSYGQAFELDRSMLEQFLRDNPGLQPIDSLYPLERTSSSIPDVLSPYFAQLPDGQLPNIVIVVAESLGREWSGDNELGVSFTPFFDSLTRHALYWPNCLSTSNRSFGAVPAITGSVPPGPRGFQFGIMPQHNTLISLLRSNGYRANAFYASDFEFDGIYEYLQAQQVDYFSSSFKMEALGSNKPDVHSFWGYHDEHLFRRSLEELERMDSSNAPMFNLFITISAHDELSLYNGNEQARYISQTQAIIDNAPSESYSDAQQYLKNKAALLYADNALRVLFQRYSKRPDFERTIFVVTGDHSLGVQVRNRLALQHVPLLIWSPLLTRSAQHQPLVTHLDIAPSLAALLHERYGMNMPATVQWASNGLSAGTKFEAKRRMLLLDYDHEITKMLYDNHFYRADLDEAYNIDPTLNIHPIEDKTLKKNLQDKLLIYRHINNYIYLSDHLTQNTLVEIDDSFEILMNHGIDSLTRYALPQPPSQMQPEDYPLLRGYTIVDNLKKLRVKITAKLKVEGNLYEYSQMLLKIGCFGNEFQQIEYYGHITKYLNTDDIQNGQWYDLHIVKDFPLRDVHDANVYIVLSNVTDDSCWTNDNILHLKDIYITVEGSR